ncbi:hypothetical protein TNCT_546431, partial [Trichonephila clavata]
DRGKFQGGAFDSDFHRNQNCIASGWIFTLSETCLLSNGGTVLFLSLCTDILFVLLLIGRFFYIKQFTWSIQILKSCLLSEERECEDLPFLFQILGIVSYFLYNTAAFMYCLFKNVI